MTHERADDRQASEFRRHVSHLQYERQTVEYQVIEAKGEAYKLANAVNEKIQEGWVPVGGIAVGFSATSGNWWFYQAMVRKPGATS